MQGNTAADPGKSEAPQVSASRETVYRMKWLSAHNYLRALVQDPLSRPAVVWDQYLDELQWADELLKSSK